MTIDRKIYRSGYISELDKFLQGLRNKRTYLSDSIRKEVAKNKDIALRRDTQVQSLNSNDDLI